MIGQRIPTLQTLSSKVIAKTRPTNYLKNIKMYQHVLPCLSKPSCIKFLHERGPAFWKLLDIVSDSKQHEAMQALILAEPSFALHLHVYFHMWNRDVEHLPVHIYEMGWGHHLQQQQQQCERMFHLRYLQSMNPTDVGQDPICLLPILKHTVECKQFSFDYIAVVHADHKGPLYKSAGKSQQELYYMKLFCAESCSKRERWAECFAHAVSALDHRNDSDPYLHNLYCQLALAAGKMSLSPEVWIKLLNSAKQSEQYNYNKWRRIVTFQKLLVHHGLFDLEKAVFTHGSEHIPSSSNFRMQLMTLHIYALMAQVENIAAFQFLRQTFHQKCNAKTCGKPTLMKYSLTYASLLVREMETIIPSLRNEAHRHYFQGYVNLYKSFGPVLDVPTDREKTYLEMAKASFELATLEFESISTPCAMLKDLLFIRAALKKLDVDDVSVQDSFSALTNMRFNIDAAHTCFRILLLFYYWGDVCVNTPPTSFAETACKVYKKTTVHSNYRVALLEACEKHLSFGMFEHCEEDTDYPLVGCMSVSNGNFREQVEKYWKTEIGQLPLVPEHCWTSSEQLLADETDMHCESLFSFGVEIIQLLIQH